MIHGIGTDLVEVERIRRIHKKYGDRFLNRIFIQEELIYSMKKKDPYPHLAARFALKEALIKAMDPFLGGGMMKENGARIPISRFKSVGLQGGGGEEKKIYLAAEIASVPLLARSRFQFTLSHTRNLAQAMVIIHEDSP